MKNNSLLESNKNSTAGVTSVEDVEDEDEDQFMTPGKFFDKTLTPMASSTSMKKKTRKDEESNSKTQSGIVARRSLCNLGGNGGGGWLTFNF